MNYNNFAQETSRMVELMKYGINESASKSSAPRVEYSVKAADGLTYGIVNEGTKFYIKVAPKKDTKILNEDFDYIGGELNKKENEYKSYSAASKNLELKLMQINESHKKSERVIVEASKKAPAADWQINETLEMRNEINRMNQISKNVAHILTEGSIPSGHTLPEAPAKNPSQEKANTPYTNTAVAKGDKDFNETEEDYEKPSGTPYSKNANAEMDSVLKPSMSGDNGNAYNEKAQFVPNNSVANEHPSGGKVTRADESRKTIKLTEKQVLAWNRDNDNYLDRTKGTKIGSSEPFEYELDGKDSNQGKADTEPIRESDDAAHNSDTKLYPNGGTSEPAHDGDPYEEKVLSESGFDDEDIAGFEGYDDEDDEVPFPEVEDDEYEIEIDGDNGAKDAAYSDMEDDNLSKDDYDDDNYDDDEYLYEVELRDFGKTPAFTITPMTLPPNKEVAPNGARDWNDKSVEKEEQYGTKVGSSSPFENAVQKITNSVMESLGF